MLQTFVRYSTLNLIKPHLSKQQVHFCKHNCHLITAEQKAPSPYGKLGNFLCAVSAQLQAKYCVWFYFTNRQLSSITD